MGWGLPSEDEDNFTKSLVAQSFPLLDQEECEDQNYHVFLDVPDNVPLYCVATSPSYGIFDDVVVPVFKNGELEAFAVGREENTSSILLIHAHFVYNEIKNTLDALHQTL